MFFVLLNLKSLASLSSSGISNGLEFGIRRCFAAMASESLSPNCSSMNRIVLLDTTPLIYPDKPLTTRQHQFIKNL